MKTKAMIATALLTAGLGFGAASTPANAASWHKGTPSALRGKWKTKPWKAYGYWYDSRSTITKKGISTTEHGFGKAPSDSMPPLLWSTTYKYLGNHLYRINGLTLGNQSSFCWVKWKSHKHIVIKNWKSQPAKSYYRY